MAESPRSKHVILPIAPLAASVIGVLTAAMFALIPTDLLESMVVDSGIASVLSAAEPPLGFTARLALVLVCGGGVGAIAWFGLFLSFGARTIVVHRRQKGDGAAPVSAPVLRRADSHPDAPARRPLFANTDLGTPFLEVRARPVRGPVHVDVAAVEPTPAPVPVEQPLPIDLDQPLAAYDPAAVPEAPLDWFPAPVAVTIPERRQTFDPGERFETFALTPMVRPAAPPHDAPAPARADPSETVQALLERLERVAAARRHVKTDPAEAVAEPIVAEPVTETIEDTLSTLRRMAMR
ncbi:hypothetical protein [Sphingomonas psychrolutea]|uniref:Uncharacterized protein n=1 Tax=Sphingomonas psychrolutea TaxID=1259676 RepID=A0ABQ1H045_9SPHN|nr:hypothetical protein [Sphingomonas psychrolutea]GGA53478.1 hypothetical protein GCM10011395_24820 [Sphingomonas psychrolutea]